MYLRQNSQRNNFGNLEDENRLKNQETRLGVKKLLPSVFLWVRRRVPGGYFVLAELDRQRRTSARSRSRGRQVRDGHLRRNAVLRRVRLGLGGDGPGAAQVQQLGVFPLQEVFGRILRLAEQLQVPVIDAGRQILVPFRLLVLLGRVGLGRQPDVVQRRRGTGRGRGARPRRCPLAQVIPVELRFAFPELGIRHTVRGRYPGRRSARMQRVRRASVAQLGLGGGGVSVVGFPPFFGVIRGWNVSQSGVTIGVQVAQAVVERPQLAARRVSFPLVFGPTCPRSESESALVAAWESKLLLRLDFLAAATAAAPLSSLELTRTPDADDRFRFTSIFSGILTNAPRAVRDVRFTPGVKYFVKLSTKPLGSIFLGGSSFEALDSRLDLAFLRMRLEAASGRSSSSSLVLETAVGLFPLTPLTSLGFSAGAFSACFLGTAAAAATTSLCFFFPFFFMNFCLV